MHNIGGQAVIEGVMMKSRKVWTVAVRKPDGDIILRKENLQEDHRFFKTPVFRGIFGLVQALRLGIKALSYSAEISFGNEEEKSSSFSKALTLLFSLALAFGLFFLFPLYVTKLLGLVFNPLQDSNILFNFVDGIIRITFFLIYILSIAKLKDIKRVFEYHGAEHMVIHAYEAGKELTLENIRKFNTLHPRCGTSFLLIVMVMSMIMFSLIPNNWSLMDNFLARIFLIPLIAGLSYELIRLTATNPCNPFIKAIALPGLFLQKVTTRKPSPDQIEVAVKALKGALEQEINYVT